MPHDVRTANIRVVVRLKDIKLLACVALVAGMVSCTATSRVPRSLLSAEGEFEGVNAPYYYHTEGIKAGSVEGRTERALGYFRKSIEADSTYAPAYYEIAEILADTLPADAVPYSRQACRLDTGNLTYRSQLGKVLVLSEQYDEALDIYTVLMRDDPGNAMNYRLLAALYDYNSQPFTAIAILDTAEMRLGRVEDLAMYKRELLVRMRLFDKAVEETEKLIADYPYDENNYLMLGDLYNATGKDSLALANYSEALRLDSTNVGTLSALADFYLRHNDAADYLSTLRLLFGSDGMSLERKAAIFSDLTSDIDFYRQNYFAINSLAITLLVKYPNDFTAVELYATHLIRGGEIEQALDLYKGILSTSADRPEPYYQIIGIETYLQRPDSVAKYADMGMARFPGDMDMLLSNAYAHVSMKDYDGAVKLYREAYRGAQNDSVRSILTGMIGDTYQEKGDMRRCYASYDKALRLFPDNEGVLNNYAYFLGEEGRDLEKALGMSERACELRGNDPTLLDTRGWILYKLGRYEEARKIMLQAISYDTSDSEVLLFHYAEILYAMGEDFMAEVYWKRALKNGYDPEIIVQRLNMLREERGNAGE